MPCGPLAQAAELLLEEGKFKEAIPLYTKILKQDPHQIRALDNRGYSELQVGDGKAAVSDLTRAANRGDAYAQDVLGKMYLMGTSVPPDRAKAINWFQKGPTRGTNLP